MPACTKTKCFECRHNDCKTSSWVKCVGSQTSGANGGYFNVCQEYKQEEFRDAEMMHWKGQGYQCRKILAKP
ncbi:MAG: hypothetical protein BGO32_10600 [Bacteroidetes bacterium 37-13]|nr:MAG: hypothetical protein BGO32_10600 [Bacteroidetes bacterium 37-13]